MLIIAQLPMADVRPFLSAQTYRLERPRWGTRFTPDPGTEFVRNLGALRRRRGGGDVSWENEGFYCDARHVFPLPTDLASLEFGSNDAAIHGFKGASAAGSRRYYCNGTVMRLELGLARRWDPHNLAGRNLVQFLMGLLNLRVRVRQSTSSNGEPLYAIGHSLAALILSSTTRRKTEDSFNRRPWWVSPGRPMIFVEYHAGEIANPPKIGRRIPLPSEFGLRLDHWWETLGKHEAQIWLLGRRSGSDKDALRQVRIHLLRLHAELECARRVLRLNDTKHVAPEADTPQGAALLDYLTRLQRLLRREDIFGHPQKPILESALAADRDCNPDDWASVQQLSWEVQEILNRKLDKLKSAYRWPTGGLGM